MQLRNISIIFFLSATADFLIQDKQRKEHNRSRHYITSHYHSAHRLSEQQLINGIKLY